MPKILTLSILLTFFLINPEVLALRGSRDRAPHPEHAITRDELAQLWRSHDEGVEIDFRGSRDSYRLGTYILNQAGYLKFLVFDIDGGKGHADSLVDPDAAALALYMEMEGQGLHPVLEKSGSGEGWHVWTFFEKPVLAKKARRFAKSVVDSLPEDVKRSVSGKTEGTIEIFPKQDIPSKLGSMIWLPGWHGGRTGGCQFYDTNLEVKGYPGGFPYSVLPEMPEVPIEPSRAPERPAKTSTSPQQPSPALSAWEQQMEEWRRNALNIIDLGLVYGGSLTGQEHSRGFLGIHDFRSPSGDENPSAGVYSERDGEHERGWFHSFRDGQGMDIFQYMIETGQARDYRDACEQVAQMTATVHECPFTSPAWQRQLPPQRYMDSPVGPEVAKLTVASDIMRYKPFDFDLINGELPEREMLLTLDIPGEKQVPLLPAGILAMLAAPGGIGKTQILSQLALCVSLGEYWLSHVKVERPGKVLLILAEEDETEVYRRILRIVKGMYPWLFAEDGSGHDELRKIQETLQANLRILALKGQRTPFIDDHGNPTPHFQSLIEQVAQEEDWSLIVIDPLVQVGAGGTETDNHLATALVQIINRFTTLKEGNKTTVMVAHHVSQAASSGGAGQTAARGVTALTDGMRWVMNIERIKRRRMRGLGIAPWESPYMEEFYMLKHVKSNYTRCIEPIVMKREENGTLSLIPRSLPEWSDFAQAWFNSAIEEEEQSESEGATPDPPQRAPEFTQGRFDNV